MSFLEFPYETDSRGWRWGQQDGACVIVRVGRAAVMWKDVAFCLDGASLVGLNKLRPDGRCAYRCSDDPRTASHHDLATVSLLLFFNRYFTLLLPDNLQWEPRGSLVLRMGRFRGWRTDRHT